MHLRKLLLAKSVVQGGFALAAAVTLVVVATLLHTISIDLGVVIDSVGVAEELQFQLLRHNRRATLFRLTGDPQHALVRARAEEALARSLRVARRHVGSPREGAVLAETARRTEDYLAAQRALDARGVEAMTAYRALQPTLDGASASVRQLVGINRAEGAAALRRARVWDRLALVVGVVVGAALLVAAVASETLLRRWIYRPLFALRGAIGAYGEGDWAARAPPLSVVELDDIARAFNEMAAALTRQRETQLAFLGGVAHDLRTPLTALKLATGALRGAGPLPPEDRLRESLALVARQADRMDRMLGDFLDVARLEAGRFELRMERCDLRGLAGDAVELFRAGASAHSLALVAPEEPVVLRCDPVRIGQVLNNLLSNALKYSPRGGRVELAIRQDRDGVVLRVSDEGLGIASAEVPRIFEPFRRLSASSHPDIPGVGLGLSVSRNIVEAHGGTIRVESAPGVGSTFEVRLPASTS